MLAIINNIYNVYIIFIATYENAFAFSKSLSLNNHKDGRPTFPKNYLLEEIIKFFTVPLVYINRLDVYNIPRSCIILSEKR